jgi:hypothetical protein
MGSTGNSDMPEQQRSVEAMELRGFSLFNEDLQDFHIGLDKAVRKLEFIGFIPNKEGKREDDGLVVIMLPFETASEPDPMMNPIQFFYDYSVQAYAHYTPVTDSDILVKQKPLYSLACFDLGQFVSVTKNHLARHGHELGNAEYIEKALDALIEKARTSHVLPSDQLDDYLQKSAARNNTGRFRDGGRYGGRG